MLRQQNRPGGKPLRGLSVGSSDNSRSGVRGYTVAAAVVVPWVRFTLLGFSRLLRGVRLLHNLVHEVAVECLQRGTVKRRSCQQQTAATVCGVGLM